jgi:hypothetical protein
MFELRYNRRNKLEYRTWKVRIDASGAITPLPAPIEWTPWTEVPSQVQQDLDQRGQT